MTGHRVWLFPYWHFQFEFYYAKLTLPQGRDACLDYRLDIKLRDGDDLNAEEEAQYKSMVDVGYAFKKAWEAGRYIPPEAMPTKMFKEPIYDLPQGLPDKDEMIFNIIDGYIIINQDFYDVLSKARLGKTHFSQVKFYDIVTQELLLDTPYYFINIAEQREWVDTNKSKGISKNRHNPSSPIFYVRSPQKDDIKLCSQARASEVDIWCDPQFDRSFFMSDRLVNQLIQIGISPEQLHLIACEIL